ncbi:MAG: ATP-binding protein [Armatimonadetes bacterium]|nr:ATP-binding protein [Armatimonadota bacterium]
MARKPLVSKLFPINFIITLISVVIIGLYASSYLRELYFRQVEDDLQVRTQLIRRELEVGNREQGTGNRREGEAPAKPWLHAAEASATVKALGETSRTRVTLIAPDGTVIADSEHDPDTMENHADRPEVRRALAGGTGISRRFSPTLRMTMVYHAVPMTHGGRVSAVLRTALPAHALDAVPATAIHRIIIGALLIVILAGIASYLAVRRIGEPLMRMKSAAVRFASGDLASRVAVPDTEEFASLADTLNSMAEQLDMYLRTIRHQSGEQQAILSSMNEGVVAVDKQERVLILNPAAEALLGVTADSAKGRPIHEVIRHPSLRQLLLRLHATEANEPAVDEFAIHTPSEKLVQVIGTALKDAQGSDIGALVVLTDVTNTRRLEGLRRDFVANVSHELRTPITSIKGFAETLRDGAINDPEKAKEFLAVLARQADRLNSIIEDLLTLSRLEQAAGTADIPLELTPIKNIIDTAIEDCQLRAAEHGVSVNIECEPDLKAEVNAPLLEQAIVNLLDNAIKHGPGGTVTVKAKGTSGELVISVADTGCGIEQEHISRLFERFYRVDKARSRKLGGTGLGLAIVKHIVQVHQGIIDVQSAPGRGSTFSIRIPSRA